MRTTWEPSSWKGSGGLISARKIEENCSGSKHFTLLSLFAVQQLKQSSSLRTDPILCRPLTPRCSRALPQPPSPSPSTAASLCLSLPLSVAASATSSWLSLPLFINTWQRWPRQRNSQTPQWAKGLSLQEIWSTAVACESEFGLGSAHYAKRTFASFTLAPERAVATDVLWVLKTLVRRGGVSQMTCFCAECSILQVRVWGRRRMQQSLASAKCSKNC